MTYREEEDKKLNEKLKNILKELPDFCRSFFLSINDTTLPRTRYVYAFDLKLFFTYLAENEPEFAGKKITDITLEDFRKIKAITIDEYLFYLTNYETELKTRRNKCKIVERNNKAYGKSRKLSAVRRLFKFLYSKGYIDSNPGELVQTPKIREKTITRLEPNETADMLDEVESGSALSAHQAKYHERTKERDLAIITLLLGTGIRVSECVGLNISDIDFDEQAFKIIRKGGKEAILYYGDEVAEALNIYMEVRNKANPKEGSQDALFLSMQNKRITTRAVQLLVKKYSSLSVSLKKITPHKLRSTYGTELYNETGDIYLVADVLGHADVNTTTRHYVTQLEENRRRAARIVKLREDK